MSDERGKCMGVARRTFLATAGAGFALGAGTGSARTDARSDAPLVFEVDADATRLAAAIAADLEIGEGAVETRVRRAGPERRVDENGAREPDVRIATGVEPSGPNPRTGDVRARFVVPLDAGRFVPATERWYASRAARGLGNPRGPGNVERWVEFGVASPDDGDGRTLDHLTAGLERVRPRRPAGSAATVLVYGTRAFQYASGFGGRGHYEIDGDCLRSVRPGTARSTDEGVPVIRTARVTVNRDSEMARGVDLERAVGRYAVGSGVLS